MRLTTGCSLIAVVASLTLGVVNRSPAGTAADFVVMAAGDIACDPGNPASNSGNGTAEQCRQRYTAQQLAGADAVLPLGDIQYTEGALSAFNASYDPTWGAYKSITYPVPGNHEYEGVGFDAAGYYTYFGPRAGDPAKGYYSFDLGSWHLIALNSECLEPAWNLACASTQQQWLEADLAANSRACILAYWHRPRFSGGEHGDDPRYDQFWQTLYAAGTDIVLNGHEHDYERFKRLNPQGVAVPNGIREFVVGTGGDHLSRFASPIRTAMVDKRDSWVFGVLKLTLRPGSYDWEFLVESSTRATPLPEPFSDSGTDTCATPTAVGVSSFSAARTRAGVRLDWRTGTESGLAGFHVLRERRGRLVRITRAPIPAAGTVAGRRYSWLDRRGAPSGARYRLQGVGVDGRRWSLGTTSPAR